MPAQVTRVTAMAAPAVTIMATNLVEQTLSGVYSYRCVYSAYRFSRLIISLRHTLCVCIADQTLLSTLHGNREHLKNGL